MIVGTRRAGPSASVPSAWLSMLDVRLGRLNWSKKDLARAAGCTPAEITRLYQGRPSRWLEPIIETVNRRMPAMPLPPPSIDVQTDEDWDWVNLGRRLYRASDGRYREIKARIQRAVEMLERIASADRELDEILPGDPDKADT